PGTYATQTTVGGGQYLVVGDFDANGSPDLIVAHASNLVGMLLNTTVPVAAPATPDLQSASDSGASSSDNVTRINNPTFDIANVTAGAALDLLRDGVVVRTLTNVAGGTVAIQDPGPVADGVHFYTARQT